MSKNIIEIAKHFKPASLILFIAVIGGQMLNVGAAAQTQAASSTLKAELKSSAEAKRALSNIGTRDFKRIKNVRVREASSRALAALKAIANNTSRAREATLTANFARSIKTLKGLAQSGSTNFEACDNDYERCIEICKEIGSDCNLCELGQNGCYLNKLTMEMSKDPNDPTL
jgi:hypothetical protein